MGETAEAGGGVHFMEGPECQNEGCGIPLGLEEALTCRGMTNPAICDAGSSEKGVRQWGGLGKQPDR